MIVPFVVGGLMLLLAVLIAVGRGDWLIAGYNTASKEQRKKVNIKRLRLLVSLLCTAVGAICIIDGLVGLGTLHFTMLMLWAIVPILILANTWAMKR